MTRVLGLVLLAAIAGALLWGAAEQHYRGCVEARVGAAVAANLGGSSSSPGSYNFTSPAAVNLRGCSRWPFGPRVSVAHGRSPGAPA